ncbi:MAG: FecR family protein [Acidobacteriota bacterium]
MKESFEEKMSAADGLIDRAARQIQQAEPDPEVVAAAANRVWGQLAGKYNQRRGMKLIRGDGDAHGEAVEAIFDTEPANTAPARGTRWGLWALAALMVLGVGVGQILVREMWHSGPSATVKTVDGQLFRVERSAHVPLEVGAEIREGEVIRSGRDGGAVVALADGSLVELDTRSELSIDESRKGTTLDLSRGNVIVEAAKQRSRHLYVQTNDCLVSVTGTIFSVSHGTKGSRVSVIEGEVRVDHSGREDVLLPGDQVTTHRLLAPLQVAEDIAWSQNVDGYIEILREYTALRREVEERVSQPELRYSSRLLDLMPEDTVVYAAAPNFAQTVTETHQVFKDQLAESPALQDWMNQNASGFQDKLDDMIAAFGEFGGYLGQELAVGGQGLSDDFRMVVLAEVLDPAGLQDFVERQIAEHGGSKADGPVFIDDPNQAGENDFWIYFQDGIAISSTSGETLRQVAGILGGETNPFVGSSFYRSVSDLYLEGAGYLMAADLNQVFDSIAIEDGGDGEDDDSRWAALGVDNARHVIFEQKRSGDATHHRAAITFDEARQGIASWLAEPAPMGGLEFVSPDARVAAGFVFKDPALLFDDILQLSGEIPTGLRRFEERYGLSARDDLAASIGGELVVAVDGPLLPQPAFKIILEIYDPARFQWAMEQALAEANTQLAAAGKPTLEMEQTESGGRTFYKLPAELVDIHYAFVEGYLVMAGNRALIEQAIRFKESGYTITASPKFLALLPQDGRNNFSALAYQDFSGLAQTIAEQLAGSTLTDEQQSALATMDFDRPMVSYAYGEDQRILVAAASDQSFLESLILRAFGLRNPAGFESLFQAFVTGS